MSGFVPRNRGNKGSNRTGVTVSRRLRAAGWNISPSGRKYKSEGIFVSAGCNLVTVLFDLGIDAKNARLARKMADELEGLGWAVDVQVTLPEGTGAAFIHFEYRKEAAPARTVAAWEQPTLW